MDNAASLNQQIDEAILNLKDRGYGAHWFPDSYGKIFSSPHQVHQLPSSYSHLD